MSDTKLTQLHPKQQEQNQFYHMRLRFVADVGLTDLNNMLQTCGFHETPIAQKLLDLSMEQTVTFIPDDETLKEYAQAIQDSYNEGHKEAGVFVKNCRFECYEYLYAVKPELEDTDN